MGTKESFDLLLDTVGQFLKTYAISKIDKSFKAKAELRLGFQYILRELGARVFSSCRKTLPRMNSFAVTRGHLLSNSKYFQSNPKRSKRCYLTFH